MACSKYITVLLVQRKTVAMRISKNTTRHKQNTLGMSVVHTLLQELTLGIRSGDGGFYPSTQRYYRMLILLCYYTATCFGRTTIFKHKIYNSPSSDLTHATGCKHPRLNLVVDVTLQWRLSMVHFRKNRSPCSDIQKASCITWPVIMETLRM
jgi:hypothetical protein